MRSFGSSSYICVIYTSGSATRVSQLAGTAREGPRALGAAPLRCVVGGRGGDGMGAWRRRGKPGQKGGPEGGPGGGGGDGGGGRKTEARKNGKFAKVRFPEGFGTKKVAHFVWGKRPTRASPILKRSPAAENGQVNHCTHNFRPNG